MAIEAQTAPPASLPRDGATGHARRAWFVAGVASAVALIGGAALYVWVTRGGDILFDLAAVFCA